MEYDGIAYGIQDGTAGAISSQAMLNDSAARFSNALTLEGANPKGTLGQAVPKYRNLRSLQLHTSNFDSSSANFVAVGTLLSSMKSRIFSRTPCLVKAR